MSETQPSPSHEHAERTRPIGRFLLALELGEPARNDAYVYAQRFASNYRDIINPRVRASRVSVEQIEGRRVELEFCDARDESPIYVWRISAGREQYDLRCDEQGVGATYYEFSEMRAVLRKRELFEPDDLTTLQQIVEYMTDTYDFHKNTSAIRGDSTRTHAALQALAHKKASHGLSHGEEKECNALRSHLAVAGFPVGSRDISHHIPLIQ